MRKFITQKKIMYGEKIPVTVKGIAHTMYIYIHCLYVMNTYIYQVYLVTVISIQEECTNSDDNKDNHTPSSTNTESSVKTFTLDNNSIANWKLIVKNFYTKVSKDVHEVNQLMFNTIGIRLSLPVMTCKHVHYTTSTYMYMYPLAI